ncbi:hypothetical protein CBR_g18812 [Chara braunii]|uniref:CCHC-type domain-containing protein n=1 Tax=Chara braunii TaxID=69332 RepID=A0A388KWJ0_CHABU|nr:hypothetical protein CBR_g18812 [Chara braunii]|eukprot:GBG74401.1 hypothetical protein CBR_g18812 [Chara braunii]
MVNQNPAVGYGAAAHVPPGPSISQPGIVTCYICGKSDHYARNCWAGGNGRPPQQFQQQVPMGGLDEEANEMRAYFRKKIQKQKAAEERGIREEEERRRREEDDRKKADRLREAEAREARLEARLLRLMTQQTKAASKVVPMPEKKKSPNTKVRVLREIRSYLDESEDESDEVREEAGRLIDAIERRKGKRKSIEEKRPASLRMKTNRAAPILVQDDGSMDEMRTPPARRNEDFGASNGEILNFALEMHQQLSAKRAPELRRICNEEGVEWTKKYEAVTERVRCRTRLAYGEPTESISRRNQPLPQTLISTGGEIWIDRWKVVRSKVGESVVTIQGRDNQIKECKKEFEAGGIFRILRIEIMPSSIEHRKYILRDLLRQPWRIKLLYRKNAREMLALYMTASLFGKKITRLQLKMKIAKAVRTVHGTDIRKRPLLKIPFTTVVGTAKLRSTTAKVIGDVVCEPHLRAYLVQRMRLLYTRNPTVGQIIHSQRTCSNAKEVQCTCAGYRWPRSRGHVKCNRGNLVDQRAPPTEGSGGGKGQPEGKELYDGAKSSEERRFYSADFPVDNESSTIRT